MQTDRGLKWRCSSCAYAMSCAGISQQDRRTISARKRTHLRTWHFDAMKGITADVRARRRKVPHTARLEAVNPEQAWWRCPHCDWCILYSEGATQRSNTISELRRSHARDEHGYTDVRDWKSTCSSRSVGSDKKRIFSATSRPARRPIDCWS